MRFAIAVLLCCATVEAAPPSISSKIAGTQLLDGYFPLHWDAAQGKMWLQVVGFDQEFLYQTSLPAGVGSNDIGLDRGQLGHTRVVRWERHGPKLLLVQPNYRFRAVTSDPAERGDVRESFAESVLWGFNIEAEEDGKVLVDATPFFLRDAHGAAEVLQRTHQGAYRVEPSRCAIYLPRTKNFPSNTEVEAIITLTGGPAGPWLNSVTPSPDAVTVRQHHSFVKLPGEGYRPRPFDPRSSFGSISYMDFATPLSEPITKRFLVRHRLQKKDPSAPLSDPVKPIVYYLDRGTPEPIRSALLEGARWWNQAFEAAGFRNGFQVELMPEDADPMDARYNVIQWVHRSTRGWSYGASVVDPRTGEIIKGHVSLGSLRVRQDFLIAEAFLAPYEDGKPPNPAMQRMALDRLRQLSAHEVGHTLGLAHNYIASTRDRASVMDYPHPWIALDAAGVPDFSNAYATGIGVWDKISIRYGYSDFAPGADEKAALNDILLKAAAERQIFLTDQDARPLGSAHPEVHLWDSGANAPDELNRFLKVRAKAIDRFGENNIRDGVPMALLEDVLVPLYLSHRYQTEAAAKSIGGLRYSYALRGDGQVPAQMVSGQEQRRALDAVLLTLKPETLVLPERVVRLIPPRPAGYPQTRELFAGRTGLTFDPAGAAESAAQIPASLLFQPERAARLVEYHSRDPKLPGLEEVIDRTLAATWKAPHSPGYAGEVQRSVDAVVLRHLMALAASEDASSQVRAVAWAKLGELKAWAAAAAVADSAQRAHFRLAVHDIERFEKDPKALALPRLSEPPPGQPIGDTWLSCDSQ
jgi:hypothetical protein